MATQLGVTFTGLRFENPFLLASAPPTESDSNIMRAFDAGWGGVVTKTIGLHPVVNVAGPKTKFLRATPDSPHLSMQKRPGTALHSSWNWELISDKPLDWWVPRIARIKQAHPDRILVASIMAGSGSDEELRALADAGEGLPGRRRRRARAEPVVPAHGPQGHGLEHRQGSGAHLDRHAGRQGSRARAGVGQAHAVDHRHRRRGARRVSRRRRRDHVVEHVPVAAADRSRDARVRDERRRLRVERRPGRAGDPAAVAGEDGAADAGVSRQGVLRHRRHRRVRARAELLPARLRHGAGLHGGDARSRDRPERDHSAARRAWRAAMERHGWTTLEDFRGLRRDRVVAHSKIRRPDAEGVSRRLRRPKATPRSRRRQRPRRRAVRDRPPASLAARLRRADRGPLGQPALEPRPRADAARRAAPGPPITSPRSGSA